MSAAPDPARLRDAATVILLRRDGGSGRVLMGQRGANAAFMPSKYVFPGGAVDAADAEVTLGPADPVSHARLGFDVASGAPGPDALLGAALRELAEETGLLIGQPGDSDIALYREAGVQPDISGLHFVFRAVTPPGRPRRFDARFFLADAAQIHGDPDDFSRACDELSHLHWVGLDEVRALQLPFITEVVLAEIASIAAAAGEGKLRPPASVPFFDNRDCAPRFAQIGAAACA
ncbi:MAG: NUDIX hydrolase [Paracoccus sp. (in: a-proteobacteria)]|nr:NUDIX hydrolase [Paracoccus sp. (in: a-proteobacteria)]